MICTAILDQFRDSDILQKAIAIQVQMLTSQNRPK